MAKTQKAKTKEKCLKLWAEIVKARYGNKCIICGSTKVQSHHLISRRWVKYCTNLHNGIPLCAGHHKMRDDLSAHFSMRSCYNLISWLKDHKPEVHKWFMDNKEQVEKGYKIDWNIEYKRLLSELDKTRKKQKYTCRKETKH